jgi:DNA repair exonuclease SbcCD ATPase subunit
MEIKKIALNNFKKTSKKVYELEESLVKISGKNGSGKTTIKESVIFCLYGTDEFGGKSDKFIKNGEDMCSVEITFVNDLGFEYKLKREKTLKGSKAYFYDGSQKFEDCHVPQRDLESLIPPIKEFLCIFNVGYFMTMDDKEKRTFMLSFTEEIDKNDIYYSLGGTKDLLEKHRDILFKDDTYKRIIATGKEKRATFDNRSNRLEFLSPANVPETTLKDVSARIVRIEDDISKQETIQIEHAQYNNDLARVQDKLDNNKRVKEELKTLKILKDVERPTRDKINQLTEEKYAVETAILLPKTKCPTCLQKIKVAHKDKIERLNVKNGEKVEKINESIKKAEEKYSQDVFLFDENEKQKVKEETLKNQIVEVVKPEKPTSKKMLEEDFQKKKTTLANLRQKNMDFTMEMQEIERIEKQNSAIEKERNQIQAEIITLGEDLEDLRKLKEIFSPSGMQAEEMRRKLSPIVTKFKELIPGLTIDTVEALKTVVGLKEVFKVKVNGRSYSKLSTGERLRVNLAMSTVLNGMITNEIGIFFIDNAESLDKLPELPKGQVFVSTVSNDKLKVDGISNKGKM